MNRIMYSQLIAMLFTLHTNLVTSKPLNSTELPTSSQDITASQAKLKQPGSNMATTMVRDKKDSTTVEPVEELTTRSPKSTEPQTTTSETTFPPTTTHPHITTKSPLAKLPSSFIAPSTTTSLPDTKTSPPATTLSSTTTSPPSTTTSPLTTKDLLINSSISLWTTEISIESKSSPTTAISSRPQNDNISESSTTSSAAIQESLSSKPSPTEPSTSTVLRSLSGIPSLTNDSSTSFQIHNETIKGKTTSHSGVEASKQARKGMTAGAIAGLIMSILIGGAILSAGVIIFFRHYCVKTQDYDEVEMT